MKSNTLKVKKKKSSAQAFTEESMDDSLIADVKCVPKKSSLAKLSKSKKLKTDEKKKKKLKELQDSNVVTTIDKATKVAKKHKESLKNLKNIDPEFYKFLQENDKKLLNFEADNDDAEMQDDKEERSDDSDDEELIHKPNEQLEVASDESDFGEQDNDDDDEKTVPSTGQVITLKLLKKWQIELTVNKVNVETIKNVIFAVNSALLSISGEKMTDIAYKVEGAAIFNGIIQLSVLHLHQAIERYLGLSKKTLKKPHKCKKWNKLRTSLRGYFIDLTKLLEHISSPNILIVLLKHLHQISSMIGSFSSLTKPILKRLVTLWSTAEETVRVLAFLCILKITRTQPTSLLNVILKVMYLAYVRNSKFVSPGTLPSINFMRRSLTEMFALDLNVSYHHVFLYIRQLAIHLRNAITLKKKDSFQTVYNWQFVNSLRLWVELLSATSNKIQLQPLIYPLVSIIIGVIKLIPTAQYFPLRFHCVQILIQLSKSTNTFMPILPFIVEVLNSNTFNQKHSKVSMKPLSFACILRLNKGQLQENGFRDEVIENIFNLTLEYLAVESSSLSFPELVVPCIINIKQYIKKQCKNSNYSRKLKELIDKMEENSNYIEKEREKINFTLKDAQMITAWETTMKNKGTPLLTYYNSWVKLNVTKKKRQAAHTDDIGEYNLPSIKRKELGEKKPVSDEGVELFPSDDE